MLQPSFCTATEGSLPRYMYCHRIVMVVFGRFVYVPFVQENAASVPSTTWVVLTASYPLDPRNFYGDDRAPRRREEGLITHCPNPRYHNISIRPSHLVVKRDKDYPRPKSDRSYRITMDACDHLWKRLMIESSKYVEGVPSKCWVVFPSMASRGRGLSV
jgi:hypothetical protein